MLKRVDRVLLAVRSREAAEETFRQLLGAEKVREGRSGLLNAESTVLQAGASEFELLEPRGDGPLADFVGRWGEGIFAIGFSTDDLSGLAGRLSGRRVAFTEEDGRLHLGPEQTRGMRVVLCRHEERRPVGLIRWLYEVTNIVDDHKAAASLCADLFGLDPGKFVPIASERYGYEGALLMFDPPERLDRIELAQITDPSLAMGRFAAKRGESIYMGYVETDDVLAVVERLEKRGARWAGRSNDPNPEGLFVHPSSLHGMLLGVSRTNLAWMWSGRPELARR
ncbi:MAG: VOC family protein [Chloroflexi bacterium]|nr:VOC family protein [Chloroflexota bacterium]